MIISTPSTASQTPGADCGLESHHPPLVLPHPVNPSHEVYWTGEVFEIDGQRERVLAYEVAQSGWTEELTQLQNSKQAASISSISPRVPTRWRR
jgi:hypothetical protein